MHPAFSVVFFTTLSGAGYGVWIWLGLLAISGTPVPRLPAFAALALGFVLVSVGLLSSVFHLGKPLRIWRALSQWRSSWLSREGILSLACYLPVIGIVHGAWGGHDIRPAALLLLLLSLATVGCTAMIYASLKPIPAWQHPLVVPLYLLFALLSGGLLFVATFSLFGLRFHAGIGFATIVLAALAWRLKSHYWRVLDRSTLPATRNSALGLPPERVVRVFERPHTEANYLLKEMGYVLARKHSARLRLLALCLFALVPALCALPVWFSLGANPGLWLLPAALSALVGVFIERWLFFAEARHLVTLYY